MTLYEYYKTRVESSCSEINFKKKGKNSIYSIYMKSKQFCDLFFSDFP